MKFAQDVIKYSIIVSIIAVVLFTFGILFQTMGEAVPIVGNNTNESTNDSLTADNIAYSGLNGSINVSTQLPTVGTVIGVMLILGVAVVIILLLIYLVRRVAKPGGK